MRVINGLITYLRKTGLKTGNMVGEEQADYLIDTAPDNDLPDDCQPNGYKTRDN